MNISMVIADADKDYLQRISEVLQTYDDLSISVVTTAERMNQALERGVDVLLFDPDLSDERMPVSAAKVAICLYSDEAKNTGLYADVQQIQKYQRVSNIYRYINRAYADKAGFSPNFSAEATRIIGVYSPIGGSGKTTIALALAAMLRQMGNTVLFTSLEQFESSSVVNPHEEDGLAALIQALATEKLSNGPLGADQVNIGAHLKALAKPGFEGVDYIEGFNRLVDYSSLAGSEIEELFSRMRKDAEYRFIIVDMGSTLDEISRVLFELADSVVLVERSGELPKKKMDNLAEQPLIQENIKKLFRVANFVTSNKYASAFEEIPSIGNIHAFPETSLTNMIRNINLNSELRPELLQR